MYLRTYRETDGRASMAKKVKAPVTPSVLIWARSTLGLRAEEAARKLSIDVARLEDWERGVDSPSMPKLRKLAWVYRRPLATFFLPKPPEDQRAPKDFRRPTRQGSRVLSPELRLAIRRSQLRQAVAAELLEEQGTIPRDVLVPEQITGDLDVAARNHRERIAISIEEQRRWRDPHVALSHWIQAIEALGCLVFQASGIEVREMRGISFHHPYAPAILLNTADAPRGRIFTLLHEYSHLILGADGLCDYSEPINARSATAKTEVFCNKFAASVLLPAGDLAEHPIVRAHARRRRWNDEELLNLSFDYSVSSEAILRRLVGLELASLEEYQDKRPGFIGAARQYREKMKTSSGFQPWHKRVVKANGRRFTQLVLYSYDGEIITGSDVAEYLGTDLKHLSAIEHEVS